MVEHLWYGRPPHHCRDPFLSLERLTILFLHSLLILNFDDDFDYCNDGGDDHGGIYNEHLWLAERSLFCSVSQRQIFSQHQAH